MTVHVTRALRLNKVYLPIYGFMKEYEFGNEKGSFRDVTSFEFIVEALIAHSASQIVLESWGKEVDKALLGNIPQILRRRVKFVDRDVNVLKLAIKVLSPVFDEFSFEPMGYALKFKARLTDLEIEDAITTTYFSLHPFLLGLRHKLQVDIDINRFKKAVSAVRQKSKNPEGRANMSVLEGILNCYSPHTIDGLNILPSASKEQQGLFINFLEDSSFSDLSRANFGLGLPFRFRRSATQIKQVVRKIVSSERFALLVGASSKPVTAATRIPLPDADLVRALVPSNYLPPIVSFEPVLEQARAVWEDMFGNKNLAERYRKSHL
jgi:hypothetical protein